MRESEQSSVSLRHYVQIIWRRKLIIIVTMAVITAIVFAASYLQTTTYTATARMLVENPSSTLSVAAGTTLEALVPDDREIQTLASFVVTPEVGQRALESLGWKGTPSDYAELVQAQADIAANVISVIAQQPSAGTARDLANAYANSFVAWRRDSQMASVREALDLVSKEIAATSPGAANYQVLQDRRRQLETIMALTNGGVVVGEAAQSPGAPSSPRPMRAAALALGASLLLGLGLAFLRESLDNKIHSVPELTELTDMAVLAEIPEFRKGERDLQQVLSLEDPKGPVAEAYRFLRTNFEFVNFNQDTGIVLMTSPLPSQGKSTTIANLAVSLLRTGKRVAVVEGDLRRPALHRFFGLSNAHGVTSVVSGACSLDEATTVVTFYASSPAVMVAGRIPTAERQPSSGSPQQNQPLGLTLLTSGPLPPNPGEIVTSSQLRDLLRTLRKTHDYVLVDAPPIFAVGDATALAGQVDGVIVILRLSQTTAKTVTQVEEFLARVPARALGLVVNGVSRRAASRNYSGTAYYE